MSDCQHCGGSGMDLRAAIAIAVRHKRELMNLGVRELARSANVSASYVTSIERGNMAGVSGPGMARVLDYLGISVAYLAALAHVQNGSEDSHE